jgi:hypothetical protein
MGGRETGGHVVKAVGDREARVLTPEPRPSSKRDPLLNLAQLVIYNNLRKRPSHRQYTLPTWLRCLGSRRRPANFSYAVLNNY